MAVMRAYGIQAPLPGGFNGQIFVRPSVAGTTSYPVAQFATFAIPEGTGDFGGGAVTLMGPTDIFATLFEYGPESLGKALFAQQGMPRALGPGDFHTYTLRRGLPNQSGTQSFFTEAGRPFTLYAVLGSHALRNQLVPRLNGLLGQVQIQPTPAGQSAGQPWN